PHPGSPAHDGSSDIGLVGIPGRPALCRAHVPGILLVLRPAALSVRRPSAFAGVLGTGPLRVRRRSAAGVGQPPGATPRRTGCTTGRTAGIRRTPSPAAAGPRTDPAGTHRDPARVAGCGRSARTRRRPPP